MSIKYGILFSVLVIVLFSCTKGEQFPTKYFEKVDSNIFVLSQSFLSKDKIAVIDSIQRYNFEKELDNLLMYKKFYDDRNNQFNAADLENLWGNLQNQRSNFNFEGLNKWIEVTGFLLEITANSIYAQELEDTFYWGATWFSEKEFREIENHIIPFIYTKNVDHIRVNLFANSTIKYEHTMKGAVEITQETDFPESGKILVKFKMGEKRYIELFVHIPDWAEGATVTERGVKYVATPGGYSQIVRKWDDGDFVEIILPINRMPKR